MHLDISYFGIEEMWCTRAFINVIDVAVKSCMAQQALEKEPG